MARPDPVIYVWKEWGLHMLVLLSFTLQVELRILAELRRRMDSSLLRGLVWAAYLLADSTAIYVIGHLSVTTRSPQHELMAFWAPFLLLHLGGQDNITAYAIEDNQLWLRHLQTLAVQVPAAAYVLYQSSLFSSSRPFPVQAATILMFVAGLVKYGERVWALSCAGTLSSGNNYRSFQRPKGVAIDIIPCTGRQDTEALLSVAYLLLPIPVDLLIVPLSSELTYHGVLPEEDVYKVVEMQLSLMHDVFYTKAVVSYSLCGLCIRVISLTSTAVALLLFRHQLSVGRQHLQQQDGYAGADLAVTLVLLYGAVVLEITSATRAMFSSWTRTILVRRSSRARMKIWAVLSHVVASVRRLVHAVVAPRYWAASIGQHNLFLVCARSRASRYSKIARRMGVEDPWNMLAYSRSITVPAYIEKLLVDQILKSDNPDLILNSRGRAALKSCGLGLYEAAGWSVNDDMELDESILVWHIATDIYLSWYKEQPASGSGSGGQEQQQRSAGLAEAAQALSNYMVFLLAAQPYMLPPPAGRSAYVETCYGLAGVEYSSAKDLASLLQRYGDALNTGSRFQFPYTPEAVGIDDSIRNNTALQTGCQLGAKLIGVGSPAVDTLELIAQVWTEILCYAGYRCSANSHAKHLSNGGELITIAALLVGYIRRRKPAAHPIPNSV